MAAAGMSKFKRVVFLDFCFSFSSNAALTNVE